MRPRVVKRDALRAAPPRRVAPLLLTRLIIQSDPVINYSRIAGISQRGVYGSGRFQTDAHIATFAGALTVSLVTLLFFFFFGQNAGRRGRRKMFVQKVIMTS